MTAALRREMVAEAKKVAGAERVRRFVISTGSVDRYNTTIAPAGGDFANYRKLPTVLVQHGYAFDGMPVARMKSIEVLGNEVIADLEFLSIAAAPEADRMMALVDAGVIATSIRMDPKEYRYNAERETGDEFKDWWNPPLDYLRWELLEVSLVNVPGNADALLARSSQLADDQVRTLSAVVLRGADLATQPKPPFSRAELDTLRAAAKKRADEAPAPAPAAVANPCPGCGAAGPTCCAACGAELMAAGAAMPDACPGCGAATPTCCAACGADLKAPPAAPAKAAPPGQRRSAPGEQPLAEGEDTFEVPENFDQMMREVAETEVSAAVDAEHRAQNARRSGDLNPGATP